MKFASATWSDALDQLRIRGVMEGLVLRSGAGSILGPALTVKETTGEFPVEEFGIANVIEAITPGAILVFDVGGEAISTFGGLAAIAARNKGASGVIIDGACRDLAEIQNTGLWLASRRLTPLSGKGRIKTEAIGAPVTAGGIEVKLGDFIAADETGILRIPGDRLREAAEIAHQLQSRDEIFAKALRAGESFRAAADRLKHL
ncbi:MAG TPA: RraA family protein [Bryobacteraceae bacterium]|jgi:3-hexulose-6-phosphate synthase/6-phospho-3-hexuloisomerase|nr:RraA family protein [Bryobacteraceae bacterium]